MGRLLRWQRRRRFPRPIEPTTGGWWFLLITFAVGVAAINTGNNLLYLVLGMLLALILASGVLSHIALLQLHVSRSPPERLFAKSPYLMGIRAQNDKPRLPSFALEVEDVVDDLPLDRRCFFLKLGPGRADETSYRHVLPRRGRFRLSGFRIATRFPFGLFVKYLYVDDPIELLAYPALGPAREIDPATGGAGDEPLKRRGRGGEFFALREYRDGDDRSDIHWRVTARAGRPIVREREDETRRRIEVEVDNGLADAANEDARAALERTISSAATLVVRHLDRGESVAVVARGSALAAASGPAQVDRALRFLALLEPERPEVPFARLSGA